MISWYRGLEISRWCCVLMETASTSWCRVSLATLEHLSALWFNGIGLVPCRDFFEPLRSQIGSRVIPINSDAPQIGPLTLCAKSVRHFSPMKLPEVADELAGVVPTAVQA